MFVADHITKIIDNINSAMEKRTTIQKNRLDPVKLVAVTKNHTVPVIQEAIAAGILAIGENRIQEALLKSQTLDAKVEWQLIGHLQTNKARVAVSLFDLIQSVDSQRLAREIDQAAGKIQKRQDVLIQINVANEETKFGIAPTEMMALAQYISTLENVRLCGLMTVAPFYEDPELARPIFREMYQLFRKLKDAQLEHTNIEWLPMGMTHDYTVAVEEGANLVRIGTGIFGQREY